MNKKRGSVKRVYEVFLKCKDIFIEYDLNENELKLLLESMIESFNKMVDEEREEKI